VTSFFLESLLASLIVLFDRLKNRDTVQRESKGEAGKEHPIQRDSGVSKVIIEPY